MESNLVKFEPMIPLSRGFYQNLKSQEVSVVADSTEAQLLEGISHYKRVGMLDKAEQVIRRLAGYRLKRIGLSLILTERRGDQIDIHEISADGISPLGGSFMKVEMNKSVVEVPLKFLQSLPDDSAKKLVIFEEQRHRDPIIAYPLGEKVGKGKLFIAICRW